jgi:ABC-type branched-subunit amino acid transport system substrate-binding protein
VYAAQHRVNTNSGSPIGDGTPRVQLVLANEGQDESHWDDVVPQLTDLSTPGSRNPVVAAIGLGVSIPYTQSAVKKLSDGHLPTVGAVVTATDLSAPELFKVSPSNLDYASALKQYIDSRQDLQTGKGYLVYDRKDDDYTKTLREAFVTKFPEFALDQNQNQDSFVGQVGAPAGAPDLFQPIAQNICGSDAKVVFYAGRDIDLGKFITQLAQRPGCRTSAPFTILTGSTGLGQIQSDPALVATMRAQRITVVDASSTSPVDWAAGHDAPPGYADFQTAFHDAGFPDTERPDGYAIMHYDAALVVASAVREAYPQLGASYITADTVRNMLFNAHGQNGAVHAASGTLSFDDKSNGWPHGKYVPIITIPEEATPVTRDYRTP